MKQKSKYPASEVIVFITGLLLLLSAMFSTSSIFNVLKTSTRQTLLPRTTRFFSVPVIRKMSSAAFLDAVRARRTVYALKAESPIPDSKIVEIIHETVKHTPSSFNSQTARAVVLLKEEHQKLWDIVKETLRAIVPAEAFPATEKKIDGFKAAYGTVMWFEDQNGVKALQEAFPPYADKFPIFSQHASGMHQFVAWTALEAEGFGANLQHYNPLIDAEVRKTWNIPESWHLESQLVFGTPVAPAGEKTFNPIEDRVKVYGA